MADKKRFNKKTNKMEYRARYLWRDANGKRKDSMTRWCASEKEAEQLAEILKFQKNELAKKQKNVQNDTTLEKAFEDFKKSLETKSNRETMENTTSDVSRFQRARALLEYYTPKEIKNTKTREINVTTFRRWLDHVNTCIGYKSNAPLSGNTVRQFRETMSLFNNFLADSGYYLDGEVDVLIDNTLARTKIKPKSAGRRKRYCPSIAEVKKIFDHYETNNIEDFVQFYWYNLFMVLFFSGLRSEEVIGLQWKNVHFDARNPYIDVVNAISERERKGNVDRRVQAGIYHTKNSNSDREIPMLEYYYNSFESYRERMKREFAIDELGEYYVFPNINAKKKENRATDYQKQKNILRELNRVCEVEGIEKTDVQMMRHACATWLVTDEAHGGLGYDESRARDYFGHTSDEMLRNVYAKLDKRQRANRTSETFKEITMKHEISGIDSEIKEAKKINERIKNPLLNWEDMTDAIEQRIEAEILKAIKKKDEEYKYTLKDAPYVINICTRYYNEKEIDLAKKINLVLYRTEMDEIWAADSARESPKINAYLDSKSKKEK